MAEQLPRVRDFDPRILLGAHPSGEDLQPYLPRDADGALDAAFSVPGLVMVVHDSASGARRTVYEALLRNIPDHRIVGDNIPSDIPSQGVLWLDLQAGADDSRWPSRHQVQLLVARGGHAIVIVNRTYRLLARLREYFGGLSPKVVEISNRLSNAERAAVRRLDSGFEGDVVDELIIAATGAPVPPPQHAAGYHSDTDEGQDWLGVTQDVHMLADLVVSRHVDPPLSIGLFGDWGTGKSFFMGQMRKRVAALAEAAKGEERRLGRRGPDVSTYCSNVRQIRFNAWHYAEAKLWASLATHIFDNLATEDDEYVLQRRIDELAELRQQEQSLLTKLSMVRLERRLVAAQLDRKPARRLDQKDRALVAEVMGAATPENVRKFATELHGFGAEVRQTWAMVLRRSPYVLALVGVGIVLGVGLWFLFRSPVWLAGLAPLLVGASSAVTRARDAMTRIRRAAESTDTEQLLAELDDEAARLERAVAELSTQHEATAFAKSRHADYQQHLGIVSLLRRDLETFAAILKSEQDGIERIILYIDDLDRCPPDVVIKVLEAVHLLVALPVFVVLVAVDPAWLHEAIRQRYPTVRPERYLEKIFQIPFQLPAMGETGFIRLVRGLAGQEVPAVPEVDLPTPGVPDLTPMATEQDQIESTIGFAPAMVPTQATVVPYLRPRRLDITEAELEFLSGLAPLVGTPRAAKRLLNLYRLVRARLPAREVDRFVNSGEFRAVLVLLATAEEPESTPTEVPAEVYARWLPLVRRFSFRQANGPQPETGGRSSVH